MRRDSTGGRLIADANCHRCASLSRVWDMPETPTIWVPTRVDTEWDANHPAQPATSPRRRIPVSQGREVLAEEAFVAMNTVNAATKRLKIAPTSAPSVTQQPTVRPANATRTHVRHPPPRADWRRSPRASKAKPWVKALGASPQQA